MVYLAVMGTCIIHKPTVYQGGQCLKQLSMHLE